MVVGGLLVCIEFDGVDSGSVGVCTVGVGDLVCISVVVGSIGHIAVGVGSIVCLKFDGISVGSTGHVENDVGSIVSADLLGNQVDKIR